jgi:membrane protease YdiL (CAAX protease family)
MLHALLFCILAIATYVLVLRLHCLDGNRSTASALIQTLVLAVAFVAPLYLVMRLKGWTGLSLWVPAEGLARDTAAGLVLGMLLASMNGIAIVLAVGSGNSVPTDTLDGVVVKASGLADVSMAFVGIGFIAPVAEEMFFRGMLYPTLRKSLPALPSMLITSAVFGAAHLNGMRTQTFLLGLVAAILVEYTGSLVPAVLAHIGVNTSFVLFLANGSMLARTTPLWALVAAFAALNVLLFLLGKPLFGPPDEDEDAAAASDTNTGGGSAGDGPNPDRTPDRE